MLPAVVTRRAGVYLAFARVAHTRACTTHDDGRCRREIVQLPARPPRSAPTATRCRAAGLLFCSGQIPLDPTTGELVGETPAEQARRCLENLQAVCEAAGASLERAVRLTVYMTDLAAFAEVNEVYATFFRRRSPARVTVGVAQLPKGAQVEIDAVVAL